MCYMKTVNRIIYIASRLVFLFLMVVHPIFFATPHKVFAATTTVDLLTADDFAVLGAEHITNVPTSTIVGNVGLSPAAGSFYSGLTSAEVTGTIYAVDATGPGGSVNDPALLTQAKSDLTAAYLDAAGRTATTTFVAGDNQLGGQTLTDGVYAFGHATTANIVGTLTLDAQGDSNAVFIFQASSDLVMASSSVVLLTNGAQACNVFWQVTSSATLGTGSTFVGSILALTDVTDNGGSTVNGRLMARNNDVILNMTSITKPTCTTPTPTPTPTATPSSSSSSNSVSSSSTSGGSGDATSCPPEITTVPMILESSRVSPTSVSVSWGPYAGIDTFNVRYGFTNGNWLYDVDVTGFSTTINDLPPNQQIWIQVAAKNRCATGTYGDALLTGVVGRGGVPGFPNTGNPGLPNTGIAPVEKSIPWQIPAGIFVAGGIFYLTTRLYKSSMK